MLDSMTSSTPAAVPEFRNLPIVMVHVPPVHQSVEGLS